MWRWIPGWAKPKQIGVFPAPPAYIASSPAFVMAVAGDRDVMRLDVARGVVDRILAADDILWIVTEFDGRGWILAKGALWRWDVGAAAPVKVETEEPVYTMIALDHGVLLQGTKSLTLQVGDQRRLISASTGQYRRMSGDLIAMLAPTNVLTVIDLVTAQTVELPERAANRDALLTWGDRIGVVTGMSGRNDWRFTYWDLDVPRDPAGLQRWLATITNAKPIPGSDAVAWPTN